MHKAAGSVLRASLFLGGLLIFFCGLYAMRHARIDDFYITLRYANNVAAGYGPAFNPGGPPVEGFTSVLMMLLLVPAAWVPVEPLFYARALMTLAALLAVPALLLSFRCLVRREVFACAWPIPGVLFLGHYSTAFHTSLGLETMVYGTLVIGCFALCACAVCLARSPSPRPRAGVARLVTAFLVLGFLAGLARPEGFGVTLILASTVLLQEIRPRDLLPGTVVFAGLCALLVVWKWSMFGDLLPNSFRLKVLGNETLLPGRDFVLLFAYDHGGWFALATLGALAGAFRASSRRLWTALGILLAFFMTAYLFTKPLMAWEARYLVPYLFCLILPVSALIGEFLARFLALGSPRLPRLVVGYTLASTAILALLAGHSLTFLATSAKWLAGAPEPPAAQAFSLHHCEIALGKRLASLGLGTRLSLAFHDAGAIAYYSGCRFIDADGLNDAVVAHERDARAAIQYVLGESPDVIVFASRGEVRDAATLCDHLVGGAGLIGEHIHAFCDAATARGYAMTATYRTPHYDLNFLLRREGANHDLLARRLPDLLNGGCAGNEGL